ncbi:MAG: hypothetical protein V4480_00985 [Patescibacteria group bacterium]
MNIRITKHAATYLAPIVLLTGLLPLQAFASSSSSPSCSLTATTGSGQTSLRSSDTVLVRQGDVLTLAWESQNAKKAIDAGGKSIALSGIATSTPMDSFDVSYTFSNGSRKTVCKASIQVVQASFVAESLTAESGSRPDILGQIDGSKTIEVTVQAVGSNTLLYDSKTLKVRGGGFEAKLTKALPDGMYVVTLTGDKKYKLNQIATSTLTVGATGTLYAASIPLLSGGATGPGTTVPVSYLQIVNTGKTPVTLTGFQVKEDGSAPTASVIGLSTVDDKGGSRGLIGGTEGANPFVNGIATVPTNATFAPGERKLFTIKAILSVHAGAYAGSQLMLDIAGLVAPGANLKAVFPIRGTTWTVNAF